MQELSAIQQDLGVALSVVLLVSDWSTYGSSECTLYHFRLMDGLLLKSGLPALSEGVVGLLECVPTKHWHKVDRTNRRAFKRICRNFKGTYHFPLITTPQTQMCFAYEMTRIAFVLDASPTLTSTYGFSSNAAACCPMDNVSDVARIFLSSLVAPIQGQFRRWLPEIAITVVAVYPQVSGEPPISLLVRDFRLKNKDSVEQLLTKLKHWCSAEVETEIAKRMSRNSTLLMANASSMRDLLDAGHAALSTLSSSAQPNVVVATDCCGIACGTVIDFVTKQPELLGTPVSVLDLRPLPTEQTNHDLGHNLLNYDPTGALFPLHLSDESEALRGICNATFGQFWDTARLREHTAKAFDELGKRHSIRINAVQWHTLLRVSGLAPGRLSSSLSTRVTVSTYFINPIPINEILQLRIKEGYRVKQYRSNEVDSITVQFVLYVDLGTTLHYEITYKPSNAIVGVAHIHIDISGDANFVRSVKNNFVHNTRTASETTTQQIETRICDYLRSVRKADLLQSYLSPLQWSDQLDSSTTPFVRRLAALSLEQRQKHFHVDSFDCVCTGKMPWDTSIFLSEFQDDDDGSEQLVYKMQEWATQQIDTCRFVRRTNPDCGVGGYCVVELKQSPAASRLIEVAIETFAGIPSSHRHGIIEHLKEQLRQVKCVEVLEKQMAQFLVGHTVRNAVGPQNTFRQRVLQGHHNHASWDLVKDPELIPLVMRRRKEIGKFFLLESNKDYALFAKLKSAEGRIAPGDQVQYELSVLENKVTVRLHMEGECGLFSPLGPIESMNVKSKFRHMVRTLRTREQECSQALRCRTTLLRLFDDFRNNAAEDEPITTCIRKLLDYGSSTSCSLRFYRSGNESSDEILQSLARETILSNNCIGEIRVASVPIGRWEDSNWFIFEHDKQTISIVHLASESSASEEELNPTRDLVFHTVSIFDLYNRRDDVVLEDENEEDHISEHLQVVEICESIEQAHRHNFAAAAFLGLLKTGLDIDRHDFVELLTVLEFVEVTQVAVPAESGGTLSEILREVLRPVSCAPGYFVYEAPEDRYSFPTFNEDSELASVYGATTSTESGIVMEDDEDFVAAGDSCIETSDLDFDITDVHKTPAPIFVSFLKDDIRIQTDEISIQGQSARVSVLLSVFKNVAGSEHGPARKVDPSELAPSHVEAALSLQCLLNAYVAERNLERLRYIGRSINDTDTKLARAYLRRTRNVASISVEASFYSPKKDAIVCASSRTSDFNSDSSAGFDLFAHELQSDQAWCFATCGTRDTFVSLETHVSGCLKQWTFVKTMRTSGMITVEVHHPDGLSEASKVRKSALEVVVQCLRRVNQLLMLRNLLQHRVASKLLVPPSNAEEESEHESEDCVQDTVGSYGCDVMYSTSFELNHRCAANPVKTARTLEDSVLQNFAVSNRSRLFVYKDESGSVFYLNLNVSGDREREQIDLVVRGLMSPGPSITLQLRNLLQKRLLLIAVDLLSTVLTKNCWYGWKQQDIDFIHSFRNEWSLLDDRRSGSDQPLASRAYKVPDYVSDPAMLLLLFRQNICGSFFFFPLQTGEDAFDHQGIALSEMKGSSVMQVNTMDLRFFFNASKSKLDPSFQAESTLTTRGHEISRQLGSGIAIVYVSLVSAKDVFLGPETMEATTRPITGMDQLRFEEVACESRETCSISVTVVDTNLKQQLVHEWVLLTLNQILQAWVTERHIERFQNNLYVRIDKDARNDLDWKQDSLVPGLPFLREVLDEGISLPHPAVKLLELDGVVRSSNVSLLALESIRCLESELIPKAAKELKARNLQGRVIRSSRFGDPELVRLENGGNGDSSVLIHRHGALDPIVDSPLDCVGYTIVFVSIGSDEERYPMVFEDVSLAFSKSEVSEISASVLKTYKEQNPSRFYRSFGFILSVKRNIRRLTTYNWNAKLVERTFSRLQEVNKRFTSSTSAKAASLLSDTLGVSAPRWDSESDSHPKSTDNDRPPLSVSSGRGPNRKIKRLQPLTRPKLIGKSEEGSALKAVERSRARASAKRSEARPMSKMAGKAHTALKTNSARTQHRGTGSTERAYEDLCLLFDETCRCDGIKQTSSRRRWHKSTNASLWSDENIANPKELSMIRTMFFTGPLVWFEISPILPFPSISSDRFLHDLARRMTSWYPNLAVMDTISHLKSKGEIYLKSKHQTVGSDSQFVVARLNRLTTLHGAYVVVEARVMCATRKPTNREMSHAQIERRGDHKRYILFSLRSKVALPGNLVDNVCCDVKESMKSLTEMLDFGKKLVTIQSILDDIYPLDDMLMLPSRYKLFQAVVVLRSYRDPDIDRFDGPTLLANLSSCACNANTVFCGKGSFYFKEKISVNSTLSMCFLCPDEGKANKLKLIVVCCTNGRNLNDLVFRDGNNTALTVLDNITIEGAGLVYSAVRSSATNLRQTELWSMFSTSQPRRPDQTQLTELLRLCKSRLLKQYLGESDTGIDEVLRQGDILMDCFGAMVDDDAFFPSWTFQDNQSTPHFLFYLADIEAFIFACYSKPNEAPSLYLVHKDRPPTMCAIEEGVEKFLNYLLHFLWSDVSW